MRSPLAEVGLTKDEIRAHSRALGLRTWDKPQMPCLASRIPYGTAVTAERLVQIGSAESELRAAGLRNFRVRYHGDVARLEVAAEEQHRFADPVFRERINRALRARGFAYVALDLEPFRSGRLNEAAGLLSRSARLSAAAGSARRGVVGACGLAVGSSSPLLAAAGPRRSSAGTTVARWGSSPAAAWTSGAGEVRRRDPGGHLRRWSRRCSASRWALSGNEWTVGSREAIGGGPRGRGHRRRAPGLLRRRPLQDLPHRRARRARHAQRDGRTPPGHRGSVRAPPDVLGIYLGGAAEVTAGQGIRLAGSVVGGLQLRTYVFE